MLAMRAIVRAESAAPHPVLRARDTPVPHSVASGAQAAADLVGERLEAAFRAAQALELAAAADGIGAGARRVPPWRAVLLAREAQRLAAEGLELAHRATVAAPCAAPRVEISRRAQRARDQTVACHDFARQRVQQHSELPRWTHGHVTESHPPELLVLALRARAAARAPRARRKVPRGTGCACHLLFSRTVLAARAHAAVAVAVVPAINRAAKVADVTRDAAARVQLRAVPTLEAARHR